MSNGCGKVRYEVRCVCDAQTALVLRLHAVRNTAHCSNHSRVAEVGIRVSAPDADAVELLLVASCQWRAKRFTLERALGTQLDLER